MSAKAGFESKSTLNPISNPVATVATAATFNINRYMKNIPFQRQWVVSPFRSTVLYCTVLYTVRYDMVRYGTVASVGRSAGSASFVLEVAAVDGGCHLGLEDRRLSLYLARLVGLHAIDFNRILASTTL